jgi:hypothetical protein
MTAQIYADQVHLLVRAIPEIAQEEIFALKGGTGINLFVRDLPRLSVDIDLVYLPVADRDSSLRQPFETGSNESPAASNGVATWRSSAACFPMASALSCKLTA